MKKKFRFFCFACLLCSFAIACSSKQTATTEDYSALELQASIATTTWLEKNYGIIDDRNLSGFLAQTKARLAQAALKLAPERQSLYPENWDIFVLNSKDVNAFSTGSGVIFLTRGLLKESQSESELAAVIAHEMAHYMLGHIRQAIGEQGLSEQMPKFEFSLDHELGADELGFQILKLARYDTRHTLSALSTVYRAQGLKVSTAPNWLNERSVELQRLIAANPSGMTLSASSREYLKLKNRL